ncbi:MAG: DMT family transporter [Rhodobacteraceae bacterium]|nr:DMT family transporter [Paracoccaceae bacterium]
MNSSDESGQTLHGGLLIVGSMAIIGLTDNLIPLIAEMAGLWQFHTIRSLMSVPLIALIILARGRSLRPHNPWLLSIRSALIAGSMILYFGSLTLMPVAAAGAGLFTAPIFVLLFSVILFRTRVGIWRVLAVTIGFVGVLLVLKPDPGNLDISVLFPLFAAVLYGLGQLMTRHHCSHEDTLVVLLMFYVAIGLGCAAGLLIFSLWPAPEEWRQAAPFFTGGWVPVTGEFIFWTSVHALGSIIAIAGLIRGYQIADPTYLGVFEFSFLLFAGVWGYVIWRHLLDPASLAGIAAIIAAGIAITLRSRGRLP